MNKLALRFLTALVHILQDLYCRQLVVVDEANAKERQRYVDQVNAAKAAVSAAQQRLSKHDNHSEAHRERTLDELDFYGHGLG